jgi:hypothetical protein
VDADRAYKLLEERISEIDAVPPRTGTQEFTTWETKTKSTLVAIFGRDHDFVQQFTSLRYTPSMYTSGTDFAPYVARGLGRARGLLEAAQYEISELTGEPDVTEAESVDPELFEHVQELLEREEWGKVVRETCVFVEDKVRAWAGQPKSLTGVDLMTTVLKKGGVFPLGQTDQEAEGWHLLGLGIIKALRNANLHRIDTRPDHRRYALGVVGTASLLLTQLRYEHGNRFRSG